MICGHSSQNSIFLLFFNGLNERRRRLRQFTSLAAAIVGAEGLKPGKSGKNRRNLTIPPLHALFRALIRFPT
jgi:hypothetical protein